MKLLQHNRPAFSMMTAIVVIVLMASVSLFVMNLSSKMVRETTAQYQREQAMLYAKSYTEFAIMAVTANNRTGGPGQCLQDINGNIGTPDSGAGYKVEVRIAYIGENAELADCAATRRLDDNVATTGSLNILVDVYVKYKEPDHPDPTNAPYITYHKRTLQKI